MTWTWGVSETLTVLLGTPQMIVAFWLIPHTRRQARKLERILANELAHLDKAHPPK